MRKRSASCCCSLVKETPVRVVLIGRVDLYLLARFGIFQRHDSDVRQNRLAFVFDLQGNEIMPFAGDSQFPRKIRRLEIGDKENNRTTGDDAV